MKKIHILLFLAINLCNVKAQILGGHIIPRPPGTVLSLTCMKPEDPVPWIYDPDAFNVKNYVISYTGGSGGGYPSMQIPSTDVTGYTVNITEGTFQQGSGQLQITITGTSHQAGTAKFTIQLGGKSCDLVMRVGCLASIDAIGTKKEFACHNMGALTSIAPDESSVDWAWALNGAYVRWGVHGPLSYIWSLAPNDELGGFIAAPTGSAQNQANYGFIANWYNDFFIPNPEAWRTHQGVKTNLDPCKEGWRVPTIDEWDAVANHNVIFRTGTWNESSTNYSAALHIGSRLVLPAAGFYVSILSNAFRLRGAGGYYWSSSVHSDNGYPLGMSFNETEGPNRIYLPVSDALSVRCIRDN